MWSHGWVRQSYAVMQQLSFSHHGCAWFFLCTNGPDSTDLQKTPQPRQDINAPVLVYYLHEDE